VNRCRISPRVNGISPGGDWARSAAAMTARKAWASMASTLQRCQEVQRRTWCSSRPASSLPVWNDSSTVQRRPATRTKHAGDATPDGMRNLLARASWDAEAVREDLRGYVVDHLADPDAVLVVDETGDLKKGTATGGAAPVHRHRRAGGERPGRGLCGLRRPGRTAFIDRALYLPRSWVDDPARCRAAGIPVDVVFATKPALARAMIARALDAGTPASWVAGDEVYGNDPQLRADLHERGIGYVLAVARDHQVRTGIGKRRAVDLAVRLPTGVWQRHSAGSGAKGHRLYDWALVDIERTPRARRTGQHS